MGAGGIAALPGEPGQGIIFHLPIPFRDRENTGLQFRNRGQALHDLHSHIGQTLAKGVHVDNTRCHHVSPRVNDRFAGQINSLMATILPSLIATSRIASSPVSGSMTRPFLMTTLFAEVNPARKESTSSETPCGTCFMTVFRFKKSNKCQ
jgi:hypothetical protein